MESLRAGHDSSLPRQLAAHLNASAYWQLLLESFGAYSDGGSTGEFSSLIADLVLNLETTINEHKIRDWTSSLMLRTR